MPTAAELEKPPLQSKKFLAYTLTCLLWSILLGGMVKFWTTEPHTAVLLTVIVCKALADAIYLGGQTALDSYVRLAMIARGENPGPLPLAGVGNVGQSRKD